MKPLSIADYLDHLGRSAGEKAPPRPEGSPFRPRSLPSPQNAASGAKPVFDRLTNEGGETQGEEAPRRTPWAPKPVLLESGGAAIAAGGRAGQARGHVGEARRRLRPRPRGRPCRGPCRGFGPPRGRARRCAGAGGNAAAGVSSQRIRRSSKARSGLDSERSRTMSAPPSPAFSRRFSRSRSSSAPWTSWPGRLPGSLRALRPGWSRFADPSACLRSCASESSICRSRSNMSRMTERKPSSRPTPRGLSPSFARGPSCWPRSRPERSR